MNLPVLKSQVSDGAFLQRINNNRVKVSIPNSRHVVCRDSSKIHIMRGLDILLHWVLKLTSYFLIINTQINPENNTSQSQKENTSQSQKEQHITVTTTSYSKTKKCFVSGMMKRDCSCCKHVYLNYLLALWFYRMTQ